MKYKAIRSAAHNFGHSFVSDANWVREGMVMDHLARAAAAAGADEFSVDLLSGAAGPLQLLTPVVARAVEHAVRSFPTHLAGHRVDVESIRAARMNIRFTLRGTVAGSGADPPWTVPFECVIVVEDDRGKVHEARVVDAWHVRK